MKRVIISLITGICLAGNAFASHHKNFVPAFSTKSYIIADGAGTIMKEKSGDTIRPIASISKLMVAMLTSKQLLNEQLNRPTDW